MQVIQPVGWLFRKAGRIDTGEVQVVVLHFEQDVYIGEFTRVMGSDIPEGMFNNRNKKQGRNQNMINVLIRRDTEVKTIIEYFL